MEPTHAPGWRGRPRRIGPISDDHDSRGCLEQIVAWTCYAMGAAALAIGGFAWAADYLGGHIQ